MKTAVNTLIHRISDEQLDRWSADFIPDSEPYFFQAADLVHALLRQGYMVYTRAEIADANPGFAVRYGYAYNLWELPLDAWVVQLDERERQSLDAATRQDLIFEQVRLRRGQVYSLSWIRSLQEDGDFSSTLHALDVVEVNGQAQVLLTPALWATLSVQDQRAWMRKWVADALDDVEVAEVDLPDLPEEHRHTLSRFTGHFAQAHGANCFAAALAAASGSLTMANRIISLWLHAGPFMRSLAALGYEHIDNVDAREYATKLRPLDICVWRNREGALIHAAFCVSETHVFNKMGQSREQPWLVIPVRQIIDYAGIVTSGGHIEIYRKM